MNLKQNNLEYILNYNNICIYIVLLSVIIFAVLILLFFFRKKTSCLSDFYITLPIVRTHERKSTLTGLKGGEELINYYEGQISRVKFIRYTDEGFICVVKKRNPDGKLLDKEFRVFGNQLYFEKK